MAISFGIGVYIGPQMFPVCTGTRCVQPSNYESNKSKQSTNSEVTGCLPTDASCQPSKVEVAVYVENGLVYLKKAPKLLETTKIGEGTYAVLDKDKKSLCLSIPRF